VSSLPIPVAPRLSSLDELLPGETAARRRLRAFVDGENGGLGAIYRLEDVRSQPESSALADSGPYLSLGMLSIRQAVVSAVSAMEAAPDEEARRSAELWLDALIQRDFAATRQYAHEYGGQSVAATEPCDIDWWNEPEIARTGTSLLTHGIVAEEAKRRMQAGQVADSTRSFDRGEMT
jgi:deoxyribodipyrimidine photolyase